MLQSPNFINKSNYLIIYNAFFFIIYVVTLCLIPHTNSTYFHLLLVSYYHILIN